MSDDGNSSEVDSVVEVNLDLEEEEESNDPQWQKRIWHHKLLPYFDLLDDEARQQFKVIKAGLGHSILLRDIHFGLLHWISELDKYISLHSRRFSKDDHVTLVKLIFSCMTMDDLEFRMIKVCAQSLSTLLLKTNLLSRTDLQLPWRPLYDLYVKVTFKNLEEDGLILLPEGLKSYLEVVIGRARLYFPNEATRELLDEIRPYMCPWDESMHRAGKMLQLFLPTCLTGVEHDKFGAILWKDELWHWFETVGNGPSWQTNIASVFARLTRESPAYMDWTCHYDTILTRVLRCLNLEMGIEHIPVGSSAGVLTPDLVAIWLAYMFGGKDGGVQSHVSRLFRCLESYFHPSNFGQHSVSVSTFLSKLCHFMCIRVNRERHRKRGVHPPVPPSMRLTNNQLDDFVESVLPCALLSVFAKFNQEFAPTIIHCLSLLAPRIVVPAVLDTVYPALETLTEPHRLVQSLISLVPVLISLVRDDGAELDGGPDRKRRQLEMDDYDDGQSDRPLRHHAISLMNAILPGLDANDVGKSTLTFQTLVLLFALVPIVDCSEAVHLRADLNDEEKELCSATANFEGIVEQLMNRIFFLVETVAHGQSATTVQGSLLPKSQAKFSLEEMLIKNGIVGAFRTVVGNCSTEIFQVAVDRLYDFASSNLFDSRIAADTLAEMIFSAVRTYPSKAMPRFLNLILTRLKTAITDDTHCEEEVDSGLIWHLVLVSQLVRVSGRCLLEHRAEIRQLLLLIMPLSCKQAYKISSNTLTNVLASLTSTYVDMHEENRQLLDKPLDEYLPIRHWAPMVNRDSWGLKWHIPNDDEMEMAAEICRLFLTAQLDKLADPSKLTKDEMLHSLHIVEAAVNGISAVFPPFHTALVPLVESDFSTDPFQYVTMPSSVKPLTLNGSLSRVSILTSMSNLSDFLLDQREDDTRSSIAICRIYRLLIFRRGINKTHYDQNLLHFNMAKKMIGDSVRGSKVNTKSIVQKFVTLQHALRLITRSGYQFTESHLEIMHDLVRLGTSTYSAVRIEAQKVLESCLQSFPYSYELILDQLLPLLKRNPDVSHEQFKGALFILTNGKKRCILLKKSWSLLLRVWPVFLLAQHSEKPSIIDMLESAKASVVDSIETFQIRFKFTPSCVEMAKMLWMGRKADVHCPAWQLPTKYMQLRAVDKEEETNRNNEMAYDSLCSKLVDLSTDTSLHWRHSDMAQSFLSMLLRIDHPFPPDAVQLFVRLLVSDSIKCRRKAISVVGSWLKSCKPSAVKTPWPRELARSNGGPGANWPFDYGFVDDNRFLLYDCDQVPTNEGDLDCTVFLDKTHWGFYCWPKTLMIYAGNSRQKMANRNREQLTEIESFVVDQFLDGEFLDKFVGFMVLEEKKGEDHFNPLEFILFYYLCRNFNDLLLPMFASRIEMLVESDKEGEQRLAAEMIAGIVHGSKLWQFNKLQTMWTWLVPVLTRALENVTTDSAPKWATCMSTIVGGRDPRRLAPLFDLLFELCQRSNDSSFHVTTRYFLLQGALNQGEWRVTQLWHRLIDLCRPILAQSFQNLRERLGSCIATIVWFDINGGMVISDSIPGHLHPPKLDEFITEVHGNLKVLSDEVTNRKDTKAEVVAIVNDNGDNAERKEALLLLKTLLCYLHVHWSHGFISMPSSIVNLLPLLVHFDNETSDDELKRDTHIQLMHFMSNALVHSKDIQHVVDISRVILDSCRRWKSKVSLLKYLQVTVFSNLFPFLHWKDVVLQLLLSMIVDEHVQVRETAGETLSGLFHCAYLDVQSTLIVCSLYLHTALLCTAMLFFVVPAPIPATIQDQFHSWCQDTDPVRKHAGILCLAAIVQAFPYTVPRFLPRVLMFLCFHAHEKQPIQTTVKKALSEFRRTHQDSWHEHKLRFSDDQLAVLTDLLVSPNYYI